MSDANPILFYTTEDGEPWAAFVMGHVDQSLVTLDMVNEELGFHGLDPVEQIKVEHLHVWSEAEDPDEGGSPGMALALERRWRRRRGCHHGSEVSMTATQQPSVTPFQREHRYIVIKRKELTEDQELRLNIWLNNEYVRRIGCVVIENDWPEYELVWGMLERRVTGQSQQPSVTYAVPEFKSDKERERWRAGRYDWEDERWQDHCGDIDCENCTGLIPDGSELIRLRRQSAELRAENERLREAAQNLIDRKFATYKARNGRDVGIQGDDGEMCWIVHSDDIFTLEAALSTQTIAEGDFQTRVGEWMQACFGDEIATDQLERADRFVEESLELAQTMPGFCAERAHVLVDYVFGRPIGERRQEVGGVMVTMAALCNAVGIDADAEANRELARVWLKIDAIRAKQAAKPVGSALPVASAEGGE